MISENAYTINTHKVFILIHVRFISNYTNIHAKKKKANKQTNKQKNPRLEQYHKLRNNLNFKFMFFYISLFSIAIKEK